jgi:hypothetical protein
MAKYVEMLLSDLSGVVKGQKNMSSQSGCASSSDNSGVTISDQGNSVDRVLNLRRCVLDQLSVETIIARVANIPYC